MTTITRERAFGLLQNLADDVRLAQGLRSVGSSMRKSVPQAKEDSRELWTNFTKRASIAVRGMHLSPNTSMDDLMRAVLGDNTPDARLEKDSGFCNRHCEYVGALASAERCTADPTSIVSLCSPDSTTRNCRLTLCFDAEELGEQIAAFRASGRVKMPNPALINDRINRELLLPELDADTVDALEWQVRLARERSALRAATINAEDRGVLIGIVLPAIAHAVMRTRPAAFVTRVYRAYTPAYVQRKLSSAGNALLYLLEHPWLNTIALLLTRLVRAMLCLYVFGVDAKQWGHMKEAILGVADPQRHFPILAALLDILGTTLGCIRDSFTNPIACVGAVLKLGLRLPVWLVTFCNNTMDQVAGSLSPTLRLLTGMAQQSTTLIGFTDNFSVLGVLGGVLNAVTFGKVNPFSDAQETNTRVEAAVKMTDPVRLVFEEFYGAAVGNVTMGIILWFTRRISVETALRGLDTIPVLMPAAMALRHIHVAFKQAAPNTLATVHHCILFVFEQQVLRDSLVRVLETIRVLADILRCVGAFFQQIVGQYTGRSANYTEETGSVCCVQELQEMFRQVVASKALPALTNANAPSLGGVHALWRMLPWPSDRRLKSRIKPVGRMFAPGLRWYQFTWNRKAQRHYSLRGRSEGLLSSEVRRVLPRAVRRSPRGFDHIDWPAVFRYRQQNLRRRRKPPKPRW